MLTQSDINKLLKNLILLLCVTCCGNVCIKSLLAVFTLYQFVTNCGCTRPLIYRLIKLQYNTIVVMATANRKGKKAYSN